MYNSRYKLYGKHIELHENMFGASISERMKYDFEAIDLNFLINVSNWVIMSISSKLYYINLTKNNQVEKAN